MKVRALTKFAEFDWDEANILHIAKHNVTPEEAEEIFSDKNNVFMEDVNHSIVEKRFLIIGKTRKGRLLYQVFTKRGNKIRVISSRNINRKEVKLYEKKTDNSKI